MIKTEIVGMLMKLVLCFGLQFTFGEAGGTEGSLGIRNI